jgi:hypothetical protein
MTTITAPSEEQVEQIARELSPDVVRIRFNPGYDWSDHPAVYFRVLLSDDAARRGRLEAVADRVRHRIEELDLRNSGVLPYVNFRSVTEQARLREASWD